jgi:uncharacterized repeat protein (TIGR03837 family)
MWDVFCKVVDNYGDIGVCWRLSRQLVAEHGAAVRLWVDDLGSLARIWPGIESGLASQQSAGVEIRRWSDGSEAGMTVPGDVVVEAFGCDPPAAFVDAMTRRRPQPAWFNLEYLSAEDWVESHHLLPSPHPRLPLVKFFYFPGFTPRTGGLLREAGLLAARDAFRGDSAAVAGFWNSIGVPPPVAAGSGERELRVSLFAYANARAPRLFEQWMHATRPILAIVPDGVLEPEIAGFLGNDLPTGGRATRGNLRLFRIPFVSQTDYDRLLWACDMNLVRGEDSFVRAQWAGAPFAWHIYPQAADAHRPKLAAFVDRYCAALPGSARPAVRALSSAWNGLDDSLAWPQIEPHIGAWNDGAREWARALAIQPDLAAQLAKRAENQL